ncbi:uncharacterized protein LOC127091875 [Lathyrus oleraceus]|uniref:uncharacterized protein LOC127091875 n=1 Tax=Pisum sativum TaxID=3888 RepID=UPI0021D2BA15|nr:uncharacterized protein LOC127091875 [Pisum sativum]XP_050886556.1 uncharacterized protein LOC127091875 [Pisum sativum]
MDPSNVDILELKEMMRELFKVVQGLALGQKEIAGRLDRIESWMIKEKVQGKAPSFVVKKPSGSGQLKKEVESSGVSAKKKRGQDRYHPYAATVTTPVGNPPAPQQQPPPQQKAPKAKSQVKKGTDRQFDKPPVTYTLLFKRLRDLGLVRPRILVPVELHRRPANYDENAKCEFHSGAPGHNIEGCRAFKHAVQNMVDSKAISLAPTLNVNANPVPMHGPVEVKVMSKDKRGIEVTKGDQLKTPMSMVPKHLMKSGASPSVDNCCAAVTTNEYVMRGETIQGMIEVGMDGGKFETPSQAAETVEVENAVVAEEEKKLSISSYKQAMEVVKNGEALGWGKIIDIMVKADMFGVGYQPDQESSRQNRGRRPPFTFVSAGMLNPGHAYAVGEEIDSDSELDSWIKSCVPGNWKASRIITVTHHEE